MSDLERAGGELQGRARVGERLKRAREEKGIDVAEISARTRIQQRHLEAIESGQYASLPSITYAVGFVKAYARTLGLNEVDLARDLRSETGAVFQAKPEYVPYEMTDPTKVPSRGLAFGTMAVALLLILGAVLWYGIGLFQSEGGPPPVAGTTTAPAAEAPSSVGTGVSTSMAVPAASEHVTLTATDDVWVRVSDADGKTLRLKTMAKGERFDVPQDAKNPMINIGRPGAVEVTINGSVVPPLGPPERAIKDVPVSASALRARGASAGGSGPPSQTLGSGGGADQPVGGSQTESPLRP